MADHSSRLSGFYRHSPKERLRIVAEWADLTADEVATLRQGLSAAARAAGVTPPRLKLPLGLVEAVVRLADALPGVELPEHGRTWRTWQPLSSFKAKRELDLTARPFEQTARDTVAWFRDHGYL